MPQLFEPKAGQETRFKFDDTPTYLFRLHVPHSAGSTDTTYVKSPAFPDDMDRKHELGSACGTDLLKLPPAEAAARLRAHLKWECQKLEGSPCNLMSWSSSLLFLLQYGLYRHTTDRDSRPKLPEISLIMIGTRDFPKQTFLRDLDALYCYYAYDCGLGKVMGWRRDDLYFGEYLSQGRLGVEGKCIQMTMQQLIDGGLFTVICPALNKPNNNWASWARTVCNLRIGIRKSQVVDKRQIRTAISLAQVYGGDKFVIPLALMLLGLRSQHSDNARILEAFRGMFTDEELSLGEIKYDLESKRILPDGSACMEELKRFQELMETINSPSKDAIEKERQEDPIATISESFGRFSTNAAPNASVRSYRRSVKNS